jgi:hypothetical protein
LHYTLRANRIGQLLQRFGLEHLPRLITATLNAINIDLGEAIGAVCR